VKSIRADKNNCQDKSGDDCADGNEAARRFATQSEKRDDRRCEQRQEQNQPWKKFVFHPILF
jgi:hypothetical protein